MPTIHELQKQGVKGAHVLCPSCGRLYGVSFGRMFLKSETPYDDISARRSFRCPSCSATTTRLMPLATPAGHIEGCVAV